MALMRCRECGHQVGYQAAACPQCGAPLVAAKSSLFWVALGVGAIVLITPVIAAVVIAAIPSLDASRVDRTRVDIAFIGNALSLYYVKKGTYPETGSGLRALVANGILEKVPLDPWGREYVYGLESGTPFIMSYGKDGEPGGTEIDADISTAPGGGMEEACEEQLSNVEPRCHARVTEEDLYTWTISEPGAYQLTVHVPAKKLPLDPGLIVTDSTGAEVANVAGGVGKSVGATIEAKAGTYKVRVFPADNFKVKGGYSYDLEIALGASK